MYGNEALERFYFILNNRITKMIKSDLQKDLLMVSIHCLVYNHEPYIRQCLEGFIMQKTNFRFEAIIHDDASTDGTVAIIREYAEKYPNIIKPIYEVDNQWSKKDGSLDRIMLSHMHGKYVAYCEGDDYWTDANKLQMQVDVMEADTTIGMTYTLVNIYDQKRQQVLKSVMGKQYEGFESLLLQHYIPTPSKMIRLDLIKLYHENHDEDAKNWMMSDFPESLFVAAHSKIAFIPTVTAMYRFLEHSASHSSDFFFRFRFIYNTREIQLLFDKLYHKGKSQDKINLACFNELQNELMSKYAISIDKKKMKYIIKYILYSIRSLFLR